MGVYIYSRELKVRRCILRGLRGAGLLCLLSSVWGCTPVKGMCLEDAGCEEGRRCVVQKDVGVCVWGKADPQNPSRTVPDIRLYPAEQTLTASMRTREEFFNLQMDIYGASEGVETQLRVPGGETWPLACAKQETGREDKQHQRWECSPATHEDGAYRFEVKAYGVEGEAEKDFTWTYDTTPPHIINVQSAPQDDWKRNEVLYVRLENMNDDIDWDKSELFVDTSQQLGAKRAVCPHSFLDKPNTACFEVPLVELPDLPHGDYSLSLTARLIDELGNEKQQALQPLNLRISRVLWTFSEKVNAASAPELSKKYRPVATQSGLAILQYNEREMVALDAKNAANKPAWRAPSGSRFTWNEDVAFLGTHQEMPVLIKTCTTTAGTGLAILDTETGKILTEDCSETEGQKTAVALLRRESPRDLTLIRHFRSNAGNHQLKICQLDGLSSQRYWTFDCEKDAQLVYGYTSPVIAVQPQVGEDIAIYVSGNSHWAGLPLEALQYWKTPFQSKPTEDFARIEPIFGVGRRHLWGANWVSSLEIESDLTVYSSIITPWAIDADDALIASNEIGQLVRYSPNPGFLNSTDKLPQEVFLIESIDGGDILIVENGSVEVLDSGLAVRWKMDFSSDFGAINSVWQAALVPISPKHSVVVVAAVKTNGDMVYGGILIDSPGLKKNAPWPTYGHDLCQSFNTSVSIGHCWDGPS
ncbi:MAG: hypothetical protein FWD46_06815 [Cystobacterineae bacterium]|nr:hypothetical protein [Cystobacterineae bacterium]